MTITQVKTTETRLDRLNTRFRRIMNYVLEVRRVGLLLLILSVSTGIYGYRIQNQENGIVNWDWSTFIQEYYANVSSELFSVAITVLIIDYLNERRRKEEDKARLIRQMASADHGLAMAAVDELRAIDAVKDGSLIGVNLEEARLSGVRLGRADLRHARMDFADLSEGQLYFSNLERADMSGSNLQGTTLTAANLRHTDLVAAKLKGTLLSEADLTHAKLDNAKFDEKTQLPDKTTWTPTTDMRRFTDPNHPQYWRSDMPESPAYRARR